MIYFTGDTHFFHANIIKYCNRPFGDVGEMNEKLIEAWSERIAPNDRVYHLGDFAFKGGRPGLVEELMARLNGKIYLARGNHDDNNILRHDRLWTRFESVEYIQQLTIDHQHIVMCHYAFQTWDRSHYGSWNLHGHSHGSLETPPWMKRLDVGVDVHGYAPISYDEVREHMREVDEYIKATKGV